MRLEDLMERAAQYDENLARDIKDYVHGRKYGLVYEASKPEFVRMWKKPVVRGDIVNILPPRGVMEDTKNEDDPSEIVYKVIAISEGVATLRNEKTGETVTASVDDIVALLWCNPLLSWHCGLRRFSLVSEPHYQNRGR